MKLQGQKGRGFNDRELAGEVRTLTLNEIKKALTGTDEDFKKQVIIKLAGSILPRLNEVTGENGGAIQLSGVEIHVRD
jgi:hypothetical protein